MFMRRHLYLNGMKVVLDPTPLALGPVGTGFGQQICQRLDHIRHVVTAATVQ